MSQNNDMGQELILFCLFNSLHPSQQFFSHVVVFPPAPKKGMVKFPGKGHFKRAKTG